VKEQGPKGRHGAREVWGRHMRIQGIFRGAQGQIHPDLYQLHSGENPTAQVTFLTDTVNNR